jgi:hypothetical protein
VRSGDAVFGLGVLALDVQERPAVAVGRFEEYLDLWPSGPLAREARGRLMEALVSDARPGEARRVATQYSTLYPGGPHARFARQLLRREPR